MTNISKGSSVFGSNTLTIREGDLVTKAYKVQGLDLVIEQRRGKGKSLYLSHYSNPGTCLFVGLMKFLYTTGSNIPEVKKPDVIGYDEFRTGATWFAGLWAGRNFPLSYAYSYEEGARATLQVFYQDPKPPELQIELWSGKIIISQETARKLIEGIPQLYPPGSDSFHIAYAEFLKEAEKHPEQAAKIKVAPVETPARQMEFEFLRRSKKKQ